MNELRQRYGFTGTNPAAKGKNDLTDLMLKPLDPGADNKGYVTKETRRELKERMKSSRTIVPSLDHPSVPTPMRALLQHDKLKNDGFVHMSNRGATDGFRSGEDWTLTKNTGRDFGEKRTGADTPRPRSPTPFDTGEELVPGLRYEKAHQSAYRFTREPGTTVHAPTQANQVIDTFHEEFAASKPGGLVFRRDTYEGSEVFSARPAKKGWEFQDSFTLRRKVKVPPKAKDSGPGNDNGSSGQAD